MTNKNDQFQKQQPIIQTQFSSFAPLIFPVKGRQVDLQMKVSSPAVGENLPVMLLSHGHGASNFLSSWRGYGPVADFFAANGFIVIQPTHQDSKTLNLDINGPEGALFWKSRAQDMHFILDHLEEILSSVPGLRGRFDKEQVVALGHSLGGHTVTMLAGMQVIDPVSGEKIDLSAPALKARVAIGAPGNGVDLAAFASEHYPVLKSTNFSTMKLPALVITGDQDKSASFSAREDWRADAYHFSPGPKCLLTVYGAMHLFGGISGYDAKETSDESPERVVFVNEVILAYFRSMLDSNNKSWPGMIANLNNSPNAKGHIDCK